MGGKVTVRIPESLRAEDVKTVPLAEAETIPASWYVDPAFEAFEREVIFKSTWQYIGAASRVAKPGDYMVEDVAQVPVIVVHGQDGKVRAFANVCRHRGGVLATADGHGRVLRCHYHGWAYSLEGKLAGTPHFPDKHTLPTDQCQLPEFAAKIWEGQVYVNLSPKAPSFDETFGGIVERMLPLRQTTEFYQRVVFPVEANWKIYVDNYLEGYHVPVVHPELSSIIDNNQYLYELSPQYSLQHSPIASANNPYSVQGTAFYFWIFPNIMLNIMPGRVQVNSIIPLAPNKCSVIFDYYLTGAESEATKQRAAEDLKFSELVQAQDASVCLAVQRGLASGTFNRGRLVPSQELAVQHFHDLLRRRFADFAR
jgi:choline monooxygenase